MASRTAPPSYPQGYARSAGESAYPGLRKGLLAAIISELGPTGDTIHDAGAGKHDGTLSNVSWVIGGNPRNPGYALDYNGTTSFTSLGNPSQLTNIFAGGGTILAWIFPRGWGENSLGRIVNKASGVVAENGFYFIVDNVPLGSSASLRFGRGHSGTSGFWNTPLNSLSLNNWWRVGVAYNDDSTLNDPVMYINGRSQTVTQFTAPAGTPSTDIAQDMLIGNHSTTRTFDGMIAGVTLYNHILTAAEFALDYQISLAPFVRRRPAFGFVAPVGGGFIPYPAPRYAMAGGIQPSGGGVS